MKTMFVMAVLLTVIERCYIRRTSAVTAPTPRSFPPVDVSVGMPRVKAVSPAKTASATDQKSTLMLLDGNSLAFRAFYALPAENFKTQGGLTTNAVYGFTA